ncbi:hypothetical protein ACFPIJ_42160 [Dactylosporangium cerinum]|uniref:Uncharacterized protein n=1 Tax=Dactylosporangium cerinum TaxID=1434730 RepID=A0ABV9W9R2_9ACTN
MSFHDHSATRTPATYRTTRPATYRTTSPTTEASGPSVDSTAGPYGALPRVVAPRPATPGQAPRHAHPAPQDTVGSAAALAGDLRSDRCSAGARRTVRVHYVDSDCLIGVRDPYRPDLLRARGVDAGGHPRVMLPVLRRLFTAAGRDSTRLATRLLAYDWLYLDPAVPTAATTSRTAADASTRGRHDTGGPLQRGTGRRVIAGVGITHAATGPDGVADGDPVTVVPLAHLGLLDTAWLYLLDPAGDSVTVHTGDGGLLSRHLLDA